MFKEQKQKKDWEFPVVQFTIVVISSTYMFSLIKMMAESVFLQSKIYIQQLLGSAIDVGIMANGIRPSAERPNIKKWDITNVGTLQSWNQSRRIGFNLFNLQSQNIEYQFLFLLGYILLIAVFLIGISNPQFTYKINLPFLDLPNILSIMLSDIILIIYVSLGRVLKIQQLNTIYDIHAGNIGLLQDYYNTMLLNPESYLNYEVNENKMSKDILFCIKSKILSRISIREKQKINQIPYDKKLEMFYRELKGISKVLNDIQKSIQQDRVSFNYLFANQFSLSDGDLISKLKLGGALYFPFIWKALVMVYGPMFGYAEDATGK